MIGEVKNVTTGVVGASSSEGVPDSPAARELARAVGVLAGRPESPEELTSALATLQPDSHTSQISRGMEADRTDGPPTPHRPGNNRGRE